MTNGMSLGGTAIFSSSFGRMAAPPGSKRKMLITRLTLTLGRYLKWRHSTNRNSNHG